MKKIFLTLLLILPAFLANAQGPIKTWNDELDEFIEVLNGVDPALQDINSSSGINYFVFTYYEPESGNVIKEFMVADNAEFDKVNDALLQKDKEMVAGHIAANRNARMNTILGDFAKRGTNIDLMYSTNRGDKKETKKISITPSELK